MVCGELAELRGKRACLLRLRGQLVLQLCLLCLAGCQLPLVLDNGLLGVMQEAARGSMLSAGS